MQSYQHNSNNNDNNETSPTFIALKQQQPQQQSQQQQQQVYQIVANTGASAPPVFGRKLSYPLDIDDQLVKWVRSEQANNNIISPELLRREALKLIQPFCNEFKASTGRVFVPLLLQDLVSSISACRGLKHGSTVLPLCRVTLLSSWRGVLMSAGVNQPSS